MTRQGAELFADSGVPLSRKAIANRRDGVVKNQEEEMNRSKVLALSFCVLIAVTVACSQYKAGAPIRVVRNDADVASCQRVVEVNADRRTTDGEVIADIADKARDKGADTVLLAQGARSGSAYRCGSPNIAEKR
jgi:hypothetical protein